MTTKANILATISNNFFHQEVVIVVLACWQVSLDLPIQPFTETCTKRFYRTAACYSARHTCYSARHTFRALFRETLHLILSTFFYDKATGNNCYVTKRNLIFLYCGTFESSVNVNHTANIMKYFFKSLHSNNFQVFRFQYSLSYTENYTFFVLASL